MFDFGHFCLVLSWLLALWALSAGAYGAVRGSHSLVRSSSRAVLAMSLSAVLSLLWLIRLFLSHDYRYKYVWQTSNNDMPWWYLTSAVWGGMDGSMLLWAVLMTVFAASVALSQERISRRLFAWLPSVLGGACLFFLSVVLFFVNPFRLGGSSSLPDGNGLNPLLQNPSMLIHPPILYSGFTGLLVPFAFCLSALLGGALDDEWIVFTRRWTLIAWALLTTGIILGGNWAYIELGWGGFWAWDPVENASFLPWLAITAFLHSVMVQERRGMLKMWNVVLSLLAYTLAVFGTFLTRSGIVQSVHAFAETDIGWVFLLYIGIIVSLCAFLLFLRRNDLRPERPIESYLSREAAFLFNNLLLLGIAFATFWGVMFPVLSEAVTGKKSVVGPPFFNEVNVPLFLALLFLMAVGPLISWRGTTWSSLRRIFLRPFLVGMAVTVFFLWLEPLRPYPALGFGLSTFVLFSVESEFRRGRRARRELAGPESGGTMALLRRKPRKYGGLLVHVGIAIMAVSITASSAYKIERDLRLAVGEEREVGRYVLKLKDVREADFPNYIALTSSIDVHRLADGQYLTTLHPERRLYRRNEETTTEVDIRMTPRDDLYVALAGSDTTGIPEGQQIDATKIPILLKVFVNPLQIWLWFGGIIVIGGTLLVLVPVAAEANERTGAALVPKSSPARGVS